MLWLCILPFIFGLNAVAQDGKLLSKDDVDLSKTPIWDRISQDKELHSDFEYLKDLNFYLITYESDGLTVRGILVEPKGDGNYPVVIFNRGGNRDFGSLTIGTMVLYASRLAASGYVVIGSNYRDADEFGGKDVNDVLNLTSTIKELEKADTNRVGLFGWSRGGMMTYIALKKSDKFKTAVVGNGPTDLFETIEHRPNMETAVFAECIPNYWQDKQRLLERRSAFFWPDQLCGKSSLLILCGSRDQRVNPEQARKLAKRLQNNGYHFELKEFDTDHYFSDYKEELNKTVIEWFDVHL